MQFAVFLSTFLVLLAHILFARRPRFCGFSCLKGGGVVKERIVKIESKLAKEARDISEKLLHEIRIFNRMKLVMPCRRGVPVVYSQILGRLIIEPRWIMRGADAYTRLLYICAAANLYARSTDVLTRRQLLKNCTYVFGQRNVVKKQKNRLVITKRFLSAFRATRFKYLNGRFILEQNRKDRPSYTNYQSKKHYVDKFLPVQCFETSEEQFSYFVSADKFKYDLSHTSDTFFAIGKEEAVALYSPEKVTFGSSICEKGNCLIIRANSESGKFFVINGKTKSEVAATIAELKKRRNRVDYLLTSSETKEVAKIESFFGAAWVSRFVCGDGLKVKFAAASKYIPTLFLPTLVFKIEKPNDFFEAIDSARFFRRIAKSKISSVHTGSTVSNNINVVFLYSSMNDEVREIIKAFADKKEAGSLIEAGVFLFFIDRVTADEKAVNYLSLMSEAITKLLSKPVLPIAVSSGIEVTTHISKCFPIVHTVYIRNTLKKPKSARIHIPLDVCDELEGAPLSMPAVCKRQGANLQVTSLKSGRSTNYKLPAGTCVIDGFGRSVGENETACEKVYIRADLKFSALEEKVLKIVKGDGGLSRSERKQAFLGSIEEVKVASAEKRLDMLFNLDIANGTDEKLVAALKNAIKDFESDVFFALLSKCVCNKERANITADLYAFLIERVIGIKLLRGKIQIMPCIAITGSFELSFKYKGIQYNFKVVQRSGGFSINYGDVEYKNFLQVAVN